MTAGGGDRGHQVDLRVEELVVDAPGLGADVTADRLGVAVEDALGRFDWSTWVAATGPAPETTLDELVVELPAGASLPAVADAVAAALWRAATGSTS